MPTLADAIVMVEEIHRCTDELNTALKRAAFSGFVTTVDITNVHHIECAHAIPVIKCDPRISLSRLED